MTIGLFVLVFLIGVGVGTFLTLTFGKKNDSVISPPAKGKWDKEKLNPFDFNETQMPTVPNPLYESSPYSFRYLTKDGTYTDCIISGKQLYKLLNKYGDEEFELIKKAMEKDRPTIISGRSWYDKDWLNNAQNSVKETLHSPMRKNENAGETLKPITVPKPKSVPYLSFNSEYLGSKDSHLKECYIEDRQRSDGNDMAIKSTNITSWRIFGYLTEYFLYCDRINEYTMYKQHLQIYYKRTKERYNNYDVYKWGLTEVWHSDIMVTAIYQDLLILSEA